MCDGRVCRPIFSLDKVGGDEEPRPVESVSAVDSDYLKWIRISLLFFYNLPTSLKCADFHQHFQGEISSSAWMGKPRFQVVLSNTSFGFLALPKICNRIGGLLSFL